MIGGQKYVMTMIEAVETSINAALEAKTIDAKKHAAMIEAVKQLAVKADDALPNDNVTYPTLLKYFTALGLVPEQSVEIVKQGKRKNTTERLAAKYRMHGGTD